MNDIQRFKERMTPEEVKHLSKTVMVEQLISTIKADIKELIAAATPFLSGDVVDETNGTIPLMERLERAIETAKKI